jgi:hypothetical protein
MTPTLDREQPEIDALIADRYLERLLEAAGRPQPAIAGEDELDPRLRATVETLGRAMIRVHPSFRFEERLSARLQAAAAGGRPDATGRVVSFPGRGLPPDPGAPPDPPAELARPWLLGGALVSAAISLAGILLVAWRATRERRRGTVLPLPLGTLERPA